MDIQSLCDQVVCGVLAHRPDLSTRVGELGHRILVTLGIMRESARLNDEQVSAFMARSFAWVDHLAHGHALPGCPRCAVAGGDCRRPLASLSELPDNVIRFHARRPCPGGGGPRCA